LVIAEPPENPDDLLLWPDGFWCFREEFSEQWLRPHNFTVILRNSQDWLRITCQPGFPKTDGAGR
jgi:hypothetical protein